MNFTQGYPDEVYALRSDGRASSDDGAAALDVRAILNILWRARAGMIAGALLGFVVAAAYVASLAPTFTATAKVLFSPDTRRVVDIDNVMVNDGRDGLQNQIEILKSSQLMQQVVRRAGLTDVPFFNPQLRPAIRWRQSMPPLFDTIVAAPSEFLRAVGLMGQESQDGALAVQGGERVKAAKHILAASTEFEPVPDSRVIAIVVTTDRPQLSARVANSVAREYVTAQLDAKLGATREATTWLNARVSELKSELAHAEAAVGRFQAELTEDGHGDKRQLDAQINALNQAIAAASTQRAAAQARFRAVRNAMVSADGSARAADFDRSEVISRARSRARDLAIDRAKLAAMVDPGHERLQQIDASLAAVTAEIGAEEDRIARALEHTATVEAAKEAALREQADSLKQRRAARDEATLKQNALEREAEATRLIYETFLSRLKETTQQEKLQVADAVIISPAEAPSASNSASGRRIATFGALVGLMGGLGMTVLLDRLNNTFRALEDIEEMTGLSVLGTIPLVGAAAREGGVNAYLSSRPTSALAESIRGLRTSLMFSHIDKPPQVVVVTSSVPGEGKSTTSFLLAKTSAQMGKSTILVDCDLRRPSLSTLLPEAAQSGGSLRAVLEGTERLEEACVRDPETGLVMLPTSVPAGATLNAADALASARFAALLDDLRGRFELIVLDAPPTISVTDARLIAQRADATLYCVRWNDTARETVLEGLREFALVRANVIGTVVTMIDMASGKRGGVLAEYPAGDEDPYILN